MCLKDEKKLNKCTILTFIIIFFSNDTILFGTNVNRLFFLIHIGVLLAAFLYLLIKTREINRNMMLFSLFFLVAIILTQVVNGDSQYLKYFYSIFMVFLCMLFCTHVSCQEFCIAFVKIMYYIALLAIVVFVICMMVPVLLSYLPSVTNENGIRYYFYVLGFVNSSVEVSVPRMYGIFREPGVFACFLAMSLVIQLFFFKELNIRRLIVVFLALILTFSTAAYIIIFFILAIYFIKQMFESKYRHKKIMKFFVVLLLSIMIVFSVIGWESIINLVFNKLTVENSSRDSRFGSIAANFRMFLENPFFGKGWDYVEMNFENYATQGLYQGTHNTNSFLKYLAVYGIGPFGGILFTLFMFFINESKSWFWGIILTIVWMITLSNEDLVVNILFYLLPFYAFKTRSKTEVLACADIID